MRIFFTIALFFLTVSVTQASTWNDVLAWMNTNTAPLNCFYWIKKTTGFQIYKRCSSSSATAWVHTVDYANNANHEVAGCCTNDTYACNDTSQLIVPYGQWMWYGNSLNAYRREVVTKKCDGSSTASTTYRKGPYYILSSPCPLGYTTDNSCASLDTLVVDFPIITDNCNYSSLSSTGVIASSGTGYDYGLHYPDTGTEYPCNQCVPDGTVQEPTFQGYGQKDTNPNSPTYGLIACFYRDATGDPAAKTDSFVPSSTGGGSAGYIGQVQVVDTSTIETSSTVSGSTETLTTTTSNTTTGDGTTTTTTTTTINNCIDNNGDGISDVSNLPCGGQTTTSAQDTGVELPDTPTGNVGANGQPIYDTALDSPTQNDWTSLVSGWISNAPFFNVIRSSGVQVSGAQCSFPFTIYGKDMSLDFCGLDVYVDIFGAFFLALCGLRSIFMAFGVD